MAKKWYGSLDYLKGYLTSKCKECEFWKDGTIAKVKDIRPYNDKYGRWIADYLYFEDGRKINKTNCKLMQGV